MKYIRTKDRILTCLDTNTLKVGDLVGINEPILAKSDNIEKLCDQFVYVTNNGNHYVKNSHEAIHYFIGEERPISYYGAIWTNKGLIYVAKMNEKGELELL